MSDTTNLVELLNVVVDGANLSAALANDQIGDLRALIQAKALVSRAKPVLAKLPATWVEFENLDSTGRTQLTDLMLTRIDPQNSAVVRRTLEALIELSSSLSIFLGAVKAVRKPSDDKPL